MTKPQKLKLADTAPSGEPVVQPSGEPEDGFRLGEQQQTKEGESQQEIDWEEIDWEEIERHLPDYPELCPEAQERVRTEATFQRMLRFSSEGNWERFKTEFEELPLEEKKEFDQELNSAAMRKFHLGAWREVLRFDWTRQKGKRGLQYSVALPATRPSGWRRVRHVHS